VLQGQVVQALGRAAGVRGDSQSQQESDVLHKLLQLEDQAVAGLPRRP
jgi:hypothetical protein